jgi:hydroxymethylpyrimidine/phosphomethylpyrimidine kinase
VIRPPRVLVIAGSDSGGGAGIQADIRAVTMLGGHAMTALTALTAQNSLGVAAVMPVPAAFVLAQIDAVLDDLGVDAVKIGMIGSAGTADAVADRLADLAVPIVFDPVMVATSGAALADEETIAAFGQLARLATLVTPNSAELGVMAGRSVATAEEAEDAARQLAEEMGTAVLAKGGHLPHEVEGLAVVRDTLVRADGAVQSWSASRIETRHSHGTGCTLASAIATGLGAGLPLEEAITRARAYLRAALRAAPGFGAGSGPIGHALGGVPWEAMRG